MKTYRHPETKEIRTTADDAAVQIAALEKLGYVEIKAEDIANEPGLSVVYEQVTPAKPPVEPPALPHLANPVLPGPTRDPAAPAVPAAPAAPITSEDTEPAPKGKGK